jgi:hypothetical protein
MESTTLTSENNCSLVCSRGIIKSCDVHSTDPKTGNTTLDSYIEQIKKGGVIYVCTNALPNFISILNQIDSSVVLVTGDSDESIPYDIFNEQDFNAFISSPKIIHWYGQNMTVEHPKMTNLPIGMDYHTLSAGSMSWGEQMTPVEQERELLQIKEEFENQQIQKMLLCYSNFHIDNNYNKKFLQDRKDCINSVPKDLVYAEETFVRRNVSWKNAIKCQFVLSPHGGGLDCHRTWEALCLGCIPIVKKSSIDPLYKDLPVLIVEEWSDINTQLLIQTVERFSKKENVFNYDKLKLSYWVDKFHSHTI